MKNEVKIRRNQLATIYLNVQERKLKKTEMSIN